jgi:hypothetical protein
MPVVALPGSQAAPFNTWKMAGQRGRGLFGMQFSQCHVDVIDVIAGWV